MVAINSIVLLVFIFITSTQAVGDFHIYHYSEFSVQACSGYLGKLVTLFNSTTDKAGFCNVKNQPALGTMAECIELMPREDARAEFLKLCKKYNLTEEAYLAALQNATEFGFYNTSADKDFNKKKVFNKPILLTKRMSIKLLMQSPVDISIIIIPNGLVLRYFPIGLVLCLLLVFAI